MDWALAIILGLAGYLVGSVPTAYIVVYAINRIDIRHAGTGNVGALNAYHQAGASAGLLVLGVDAGKGVLAALVPGWVGAPDWTIFLSATLVVAGHNWPVFLGFNGGKGAAAIFGISLAVVPILTLITLGSVLLILIVLRNLVWSAAVGFILLNVLLLATQQDTDQIILCGALTALVTATYVISIRNHISGSIKARQWRELITGIA